MLLAKRLAIWQRTGLSAAPASYPFGEAAFADPEVRMSLEAPGFHDDAPLSVLAVELLPQDVIPADPLGANHAGLRCIHAIAPVVSSTAGCWLGALRGLVFPEPASAFLLVEAKESGPKLSINSFSETPSDKLPLMNSTSCTRIYRDHLALHGRSSISASVASSRPSTYCIPRPRPKMSPRQLRRKR